MTEPGLCQCGCGRPTNPVRENRPSRGLVKGRARRFLNGHQGGPRWREEDRGHKTPCWIWQRRKSGRGYGMTKVRGRLVAAHRAVYEEIVGPLPEGIEPDHLCQQRDCVRPDHLEPVAHAVNCRRGPRVKLTAVEAAEIRRLAAGRRTKGPGVFSTKDPASNRSLAERFGVSREAIGAIVRGEAWG